MKILGFNSSLEINLISDPSLFDKKTNLHEEWIGFNVIIKLPGFFSNFEIILMGDDIYDFIDSLKKAYDSSFSEEKQEVLLETIEDSIYLKGIIDYKGTVQWEGYVIHPVGDGNKLTFKFEAELNSISNARDQLFQECSFMISAKE